MVKQFILFCLFLQIAPAANEIFEYTEEGKRLGLVTLYRRRWLGPLEECKGCGDIKEPFLFLSDTKQISKGYCCACSKKGIKVALDELIAAEKRKPVRTPLSSDHISLGVALKRLQDSRAKKEDLEKKYLKLNGSMVSPSYMDFIFLGFNKLETLLYYGYTQGGRVCPKCNWGIIHSSLTNRKCPYLHSHTEEVTRPLKPITTQVLKRKQAKTPLQKQPKKAKTGGEIKSSWL